MKKVILSLFTVSTLVLVSCGGSDTPEKDSSLVLSDSANKVVSNSTDSLKPVIVNAPGGSTPALINSSPAASPVTQPAVTTTAKGMNPAHGQPGHRCDISVGAPLNSAPTGVTTPSVQTTTSPNPVLPAPATTTPAVLANPNAKVNPAHGQPGHDCAVAVGAPLKN